MIYFISDKFTINGEGVINCKPSSFDTLINDFNTTKVFGL